MSRAIVLAAGKGTRMRPLTDSIPKPLVKVGGKALIDHVLDWMNAAHISEVVVNSHYLAPLLEAHLQARHEPHITISREELLLETGGGIAKALPLLGDAPFFSANSDTICLNGSEHALSRMKQAWVDEKMDALLLLHPVKNAVGYDGAGDFSLGSEGSLIRRGKLPHAPYVFTGVQMIHPRLFKDAPSGAFSMNLLYDRAREPDGRLPRIHGIIHDGNWLHVGEPSAIALAEEHL